MQKSPIRELFDALILEDSVTVTFESAHDLNITRVRLHQIRKDFDTQLAAIGDDPIFGDKSIVFTKLSELTYKISVEPLRSAARARFTIIKEPQDGQSLPADMGNLKDQ